MVNSPTVTQMGSTKTVLTTTAIWQSSAVFGWVPSWPTRFVFPRFGGAFLGVPIPNSDSVLFKHHSFQKPDPFPFSRSRRERRIPGKNGEGTPRAVIGYQEGQPCRLVPEGAWPEMSSGKRPNEHVLVTSLERGAQQRLSKELDGSVELDTCPSTISQGGCMERYQTTPSADRRKQSRL